MKFLITESKLKDFIKKRFGIDLTNKIEMVQTKWDVPMEFDDAISGTLLNQYLNKYGPMFLIKIKNREYLYQDQSGHTFILHPSGFDFTELEFMKKLGIEDLGLSMRDLIDMYFEE